MVAVAKTRGRKAGQPPRPGGPTVQIRIDADLGSRLKVIAAQKGETVSTMVSRMIRGEVDQMWARMVRDLGRGGQGIPPAEPEGGAE
jgi:hypothetical protein